MINAVRYTFCVFCVYLLIWVTSVHFESIMDRLPLETQEQLKKMSTERLRVKLGRTGFDEDRLLDLDRAGLLDALAEITAVEVASDPAQEAQEASQIPLPADDSSSVTSEVGSEALRLKELELEEKRAEREARRAELEAEERRAEREDKKAEREERRRALELEGKKVEAEEGRRALELEAEEKKAAREAEEQKAAGMQKPEEEL